MRLPPDLHERLVARSLKEDLSLNGLCVTLLSSGLDRPKLENAALNIAAPALSILQRLFGRQLLGVVAFGSRIAGTATGASDLDLLVVLAKSTPIRRNLYRQWDEAAAALSGTEFDPHFAHMPAHAKEAGAVWLEAASSGEIIFDPRNRIAKLLESIRKPIASGSVRRAWSHGHPYWTRSSHEES